MSALLNTLRDLVTNSVIQPEDQNDLLVFLPILPEETMQNLIKVFEAEPEKIKEFNDNFKSKVRAITGGSDDEWNKIIEEEEKAQNEIPEDEKEVDDETLYNANYDSENPDLNEESS
ncbi:hypothetical protein KKD19_03295 [Patescibacteria group bacterium]|nr:hypothetical protein [Patescibacteria group bacterium]MBU4512241.1 hypothetical protein [Patescibacteria group bacterium]MCG2692659.1 hypothetical protein [Candidatus Parcubacteria bacterium]